MSRRKQEIRRRQIESCEAELPYVKAKDLESLKTPETKKPNIFKRWWKGYIDAVGKGYWRHWD